MASVTVAALALVTCHAAGQAQGRAVAGSDLVAIGVVRADGLLIPLVTLQGGTSTPLRVSDPEIENRLMMAPAARTLESHPWTLWDRSGGATEFRVTGRVIADFGYHFQETWKTTLTGRTVPPGDLPIAKLGLGTQGVVVEQPENVVGQPDGASRRVARLISSLAHATETAMIAADAHHPLREQPAAVRTATIVRLTKLWRRRVGDTDTYYFEATKQYGHLPVLTTGWVAVAGGKATSMDVTSLPADDTYKQGVYRTVLGIVPMEGRDFWVMESQGWESEAHTVRVWPSGKCVFGEDSNC